MSYIRDSILEMLPATMASMVEALGGRYAKNEVWATVADLRDEHLVIRRKREDGVRIFDHRNSEDPDPSLDAFVGRSRKATIKPEPGAATADPAAPAKKKKTRKRPVIVFWIDGWPEQDPGRRMLWAIHWDSKQAAEAELLRLRHRLGHEAQWEIQQLTPPEARRLKERAFSIKEMHERATKMAEKTQ